MMTYFKLMLLFLLKLIIDLIMANNLNHSIEASSCIFFRRKLLFSPPAFQLLKVSVVVFIIIVAFAQIDWHDFVVVETVNFREEEAGINR